MSVTAPDARITTYHPTVPATEFPAEFPVFDDDDIKVFVDDIERTDFAVSATYVQGISNDARAVFSPGITGRVDVVGARAPRRTNRFSNGGPLPIWQQNLALDTLEAEMQEVSRDYKRAHKAPYGEDGGVFTAADIGLAQGYAEEAKGASETALDAVAQILGMVPNAFPVTLAQLKALPTDTITAAYLKEPGREGQFIWTTGDFTAHIAADTLSGVFVKADGIAASLGAWKRVYSGGLKPEYFGAKVDGVTDDSAALQACINLVLFLNAGVVQLPHGTMRLKATTTINVSNSNNLALKGAGQNVSVLSYSDAATHGIAYMSSQTVDNYHPCFELSDFSIETSRKNAGTAISATWANPNNIERPFFMNRVEMRQCITRASDDGLNFGYWTRGVYCSNARNSSIENSYFMGEMNLTPTTQAAFELDNESTFFTFRNVLVLEADTGIYAHGTTEGVKVLQCSIVGVRFGIHHVTTTGAEPELMVIGTDINAEEVGVWAQNIQMVTIADCVFFANSWLHTSAWPEWRGVLLQGSLNRFSSIKGCHFSKENQRTGDTTTGIDFNEGFHCIVDGNTFYGFNGNPMTFGVQARAGTGSCIVSETNIFEYVTNKFANAGANSYRQKIVQSGQANVASGTAINFPSGFTETPVVTALHSGSNTAVNVTVSGESTGGFTVHHNGGGAVLISWQAVGN